MFDFLTTEELVKTGQVCKRFCELLNDEIVWESRCKNWKYYVPGTYEKEGVKEYYVSKYKTHLSKEQNAERQRELQEQKQRNEDTRDSWVYFMDRTYFRFHGMEIPVVILFSIWSLLIALRADEYIVCSYHVVFVPLYVAYLHVLICFLLTDILNFYFEESLQTYHDWTVHNLTSALARVGHGGGRLVLYLTWLWSLLFFVFIAIGMDDKVSEDGGHFHTGYSIIFFGVAYFIYTLSWCAACEKALCLPVVCFPWLGVMWILLFIWVKAEEYTQFNWWAALSPWWIVGICVFFPLVVAWGMIIFRCADHWYKYVAIPVTISLSSLVTWFAFLAWNMELYERDLPTWSWTLVNLPLFLGEIGMIFVMIFFAFKIG